MYKRACSEQEMTISKIKDIVYIHKSDIEEIYAIKRDMREHIGSRKKESEMHAAYMEQNTKHFEDVEKITVNSASVIQ